jgi:hypothetical protein
MRKTAAGDPNIVKTIEEKNGGKKWQWRRSPLKSMMWLQVNILTKYFFME